MKIGPIEVNRRNGRTIITATATWYDRGESAKLILNVVVIGVYLSGFLLYIMGESISGVVWMITFATFLLGLIELGKRVEVEVEEKVVIADEVSVEVTKLVNCTNCGTKTNPNKKCKNCGRKNP